MRFCLLAALLTLLCIHSKPVEDVLSNDQLHMPLEELSEEQKKELEQIRKKIGPIDDVTAAADDIFEQNNREGLSGQLYEGDIIIPKDLNKSDREKRNANPTAAKWPNGIVYYELTPEITQSFDKVWMINKAHEFLHNRTCIRFQSSSTEPVRIQVKTNAGCSANIGMGPGVHDMSLADGCGNLFGTIVHEFMHTLGFWHTQNRKDRDDFIIVDNNNINLPEQQKSINFGKAADWENVNYTPYEYGSTMHYPPNWWAFPNTNTMMPKDPIYFYSMGTRFVTFNDVKMINDHYQCHDQCAGKYVAPCLNGGYPNPNKCDECVCPPGYGGGWCGRRPEGCGWELNASAAWQDHYIWFGQGNQKMRSMFTECVHWVRAPAGKRIQVRISKFQNQQCNYGCQTNGVEFKIKDSTYAGPRICCDKHAGVIFTSTVNPMPVISYNRFNYNSYNLQFRFI